MFERFTDRARRVNVLAQEEARLLKHDRIDTEHLLLGLLREEEGLAARVLESLDITVEFSTAAVDWLSDHGYQPEFGARPLRRTIQREVGNRLSAMLLGDEVSAGDRVRVDVVDDALTFTVDQSSLTG